MNEYLRKILKTQPGRDWLAAAANRNADDPPLVVDAEGEVAHVHLYAMIDGDSWWGDGVGPKDFVQALQDCGDKAVTLHVNSPGGNAFEGNTIMNLLRQHSQPVTGVVEGLAASAAADILLGCGEVRMCPGSFMLVHNSWGFAMGGAKEMRAAADDLETLDESYVSLYQERTGMEPDDLRALMDEDRLMNADETVEKGFAQGMQEPPQDDGGGDDSDETDEERQARQADEAKVAGRLRRARLVRLNEIVENEPAEPAGDE